MYRLSAVFGGPARSVHLFYLTSRILNQRFEIPQFRNLITILQRRHIDAPDESHSSAASSILGHMRRTLLLLGIGILLTRMALPQRASDHVDITWMSISNMF